MSQTDKTDYMSEMDHTEAVKQMAVERYLLDELTPELRDAFEAHFFDCTECALDLRAAAAFMGEAKAQLPNLAAAPVRAAAPLRVIEPVKTRDWFAWMRPAFAVPVFAALIAVVGFQNLSTIPNLRSEASEPRLMTWTSLHAGTRSVAHTAVVADPKQGAMLLVDLPQEQAYSAFTLGLFDPQGKQVFSRTVAAPSDANGQAETLSLVIPGAGLKQGAYALAISGVSGAGAATEIDRRVIDIHFAQ